MDETFERRCVLIFREIAGLQYPGLTSSWSDSRLLAEPLEAMNIDSLTRLEFIMKVESAFNVELDEAAVNACRTISEFAALLSAASK
jgi:Phosphopantetheine attachment site